MTATEIDHCENLPPGQRFLTGSLRRAIRLSLKPFFNPHTPIGLLRGGLNLLAGITRPAKGVQRQDTRLGSLPCECWHSGDDSQAAVLYLHGGAYVAGGPKTHRGLASHLARAAAMPVWVPDYRLAPEAPFPAAVDDALASYQALLEQGLPASGITVAGDSAGGGLTLALALRLREEGLPLPARLIALSPWADLREPGQPGREVEGEIMLTWPGLDRSAGLYAGDQRSHPWASPLKGDLAGLPPLLVIVGSEEILLDDSRQLASRALDAGVDTQLVVYQGMWHVFPAHAGALHSADDAIARMAAFIHGDAHYPPEAS